jgi:hypothetical protein
LKTQQEADGINLKNIEQDLDRVFRHWYEKDEVWWQGDYIDHLADGKSISIHP